MIKINLLSPYDRKNFKWEKVNNLVTECIIWMFVAQLFFLAAFFSTREYLELESSAVDNNLQAIRSNENIKETYRIGKELSLYSQKIDSIELISGDLLHWSYVLEEIVDIVPEGVKLETISSSPVIPEAKSKRKTNTEEEVSSYKVSISGNALLRKDLIALEENLKKSTFFRDIEFTDSNYIKSSDIDFKYHFYVDKSNLLN